MHLGDRCRCHREVGEGGEEGGERPVELDLDQGARLRCRERCQAILQLRQIFGDLLAQEIGAGRQQLPELDKARSQLDKSRSETLARPSIAPGPAAKQPPA
jgi:hypothetical protein